MGEDNETRSVIVISPLEFGPCQFPCTGGVGFSAYKEIGDLEYRFILFMGPPDFKWELSITRHKEAFKYPAKFSKYEDACEAAQQEWEKICIKDKDSFIVKKIFLDRVEMDTICGINYLSFYWSNGELLKLGFSKNSPINHVILEMVGGLDVMRKLKEKDSM